MSKRAAIAKAAGSATHVDDATETRLLQTEAASALAQHLAEAIRSIPGARKTKPSRTACLQLALQVLVVTAGLRRAALIDALSLTAAQASAVGSRLASLGKQRRLPSSRSCDLQHVRLLYHASTGQTFVVSRQPGLWNDLVGLNASHETNEPLNRLWIDARLTPDHPSPTRTSPDPHIGQLLQAVHVAIMEDTAGDVLIALQVQSDKAPPLPEEHVDNQLVGVALAGFLLEYGAIYTMHNSPSKGAGSHYDYQVHSFGLTTQPLPEPDFVASPPNCLGSQPLFLFKIVWSDARGASFEILSFSIPQCIMSRDDTEQARQRLTGIFQSRLDNIGTESIFMKGCVSVHVLDVSLHQVSL